MKLKINFHMFEYCNMRCGFCFRDKTCNYKIRTLDEYKTIIDKLNEIQIFQAINFAGGEPTLFNELNELLKYSKEKGFKNSLITNATIISRDEEFLKGILKNIDTLGISIDSLDEEINKTIGRVFKDSTIKLEDIKRVYDCLSKHSNVKFKINTVVTRFNKDDNSLLQIPQNNINVDRWKILNVHSFNKKTENYTTQDSDYNKFISKFKNVKSIKKIISEGNNTMTNSYIMIDGSGRIYCNSKNIDLNIFDFEKNEIQNFIKSNLDFSNYLKRYKSFENESK